MDYILNRRSVRKYDLSKKLDCDTLKKLCAYGQSAPTARRQESREFVIIDDEKIIEKLSAVSQGSMILTGCNTVIAVVGKNPKNITTPHMQGWDLAAATENILIAATSMQIGSCWIGIAPLEERIKPCNEILNVSEGKYVFSLIALGYPLDSEKCFYDAKKLKDEDVYFNRY